MDTLRHALAVMLIVLAPPAILEWFAIHPFVSRWRRFGPALTYGILAVPMAGLMAASFLARSALIGPDFGTSWVTTAIGGVLLGLAIGFGIPIGRELPYRVLVGIPELDRSPDPRPPLTRGVYAWVRHPRYLQMLIGSMGAALVANHLSSYLVVFFGLASAWPLVSLEERELRQRFGSRYVEYCRRVPRFIPRRPAERT